MTPAPRTAPSYRDSSEIHETQPRGRRIARLLAAALLLLTASTSLAAPRASPAADGASGAASISTSTSTSPASTTSTSTSSATGTVQTSSSTATVTASSSSATITGAPSVKPTPPVVAPPGVTQPPVPRPPPIDVGSCIAPPVVRRPPFVPGEAMDYDFGALGASLGSVRMTVLPARPGKPLLVEARGRTGTFASQFHSIDAVATAMLGPQLESLAYQETATENGVHYSLDVAFPARDGKLHVRATRQGDRKDFDVKTPPGIRDIVSALYAVRGMELKAGMEVCLPVFVSRRVWLLRLKVDGKEQTSVPLGDFKAVHISGTATRVDNPAIKRDVHLWYSDDARRLPLAACGVFQDQPACANLKGYRAGKTRQPTAGPLR